MKNGNISKAVLKADLQKYLDTDTLIYWDPIRSELRKDQEKYWGAALEKLSTKLELPTLNTTDGLLSVAQNQIVTREFATFLNNLNNFQLASIFFYYMN